MFTPLYCRYFFLILYFQTGAMLQDRYQDKYNVISSAIHRFLQNCEHVNKEKLVRGRLEGDVTKYKACYWKEKTKSRGHSLNTSTNSGRIGFTYLTLSPIFVLNLSTVKYLLGTWRGCRGNFSLSSNMSLSEMPPRTEGREKCFELLMEILGGDLRAHCKNMREWQEQRITGAERGREDG